MGSGRSDHALKIRLCDELGEKKVNPQENI